MPKVFYRSWWRRLRSCKLSAGSYYSSTCNFVFVMFFLGPANGYLWSFSCVALVYWISLCSFFYVLLGCVKERKFSRKGAKGCTQRKRRSIVLCVFAPSFSLRANFPLYISRKGVKEMHAKSAKESRYRKLNCMSRLLLRRNNVLKKLLKIKVSISDSRLLHASQWRF